MSWSLINGEERRQEAPYTFFLPHPDYLAMLQVGDMAKLLFEYYGETEKYGGERMWVSVDRLTDEGYEGTLLSTPCEKHIEKGTIVQFRREHILDFEGGDDRVLASFVDDRREYWDRCMVDRCVLDDGVPVEYLYRETPDMAEEGDEHPDSGWRIRGRQGDDTDEQMEDRSASYVAVGAVLNKDDSWVHLLDAPIGSAFMRNFESGAYEPTR